jgi:hypothetical protein
VAALFAFDAGYDLVQLSVELADAGAQIVVRVRNDRKYFARPAPRLPGQKGRGRRHGCQVHLRRFRHLAGTGLAAAGR